MKKVCAYLRMSDPRQDTSIDIQRALLVEYAAKRDYVIVKEYVDEGKSGSKKQEKRTDFHRMLADAPQADWEVILCRDLARFGRLDSIDGAAAKNVLRRAGKSLETVFDGVLNWTTTTGRIVDAVMSENQNEYSVKIGGNSLNGKLHAFHNRQPFGFKCPYGLARKVRDNLGTERIISRTDLFRRPKGWAQELVAGDPKEVAVVVWLFTTFAERDVGFRYLAIELNSQGHPSPNGGKWCDKIVQNALENEKYVGDLRLGETSAGAFWRLSGNQVVKSSESEGFKRHEGLIERDTHQGIVSRELFDKVQVKMKRRKEAHTRPQGQGGYVLTGVLFCGNCAKPLYGNPNRNAKKSGKVIYVCKQAVKYGSQCSCKQWSIEEEKILPVLKTKLVQEIDRKTLHAASTKPCADDQPKLGVSDLEKQVAKLDKMIERGIENFLQAPPDMTADLAAKLTAWKAERKGLAEKIEQEQATKPPSALDKLRAKEAWLMMMKGKLTEIRVAEACGGKYSSPVFFTKDTLREFLVSNGVRVDVWWAKKSSRRFAVAKVRVRLFYEVAHSPMVESHNIGLCAEIDVAFTGADLLAAA